MAGAALELSPVDGSGVLRSARSIRVILIAAQSLFREAMRVGLDDEPDIEVVSEAEHPVGEEVLAEVAIIDAAASNEDAASAARQIRDRLPTCGILLIVTEPELATLVDALEAGVRGFVTKEMPLTALVEATRRLADGEPVIPPTMLEPLLRHLMERHGNQEEARRRIARLTRREREVLMLIVDGADNDSISRRLVISRETARTHVQNVLRKLDVHSRLEAAAFVLHSGVAEDLTRPAA